MTYTSNKRKPYDGGSYAYLPADVAFAASGSDVRERNIIGDGAVSRSHSPAITNKREHGSSGSYIRSPDAAPSPLFLGDQPTESAPGVRQDLGNALRTTSGAKTNEAAPVGNDGGTGAA